MAVKVAVQYPLSKSPFTGKEPVSVPSANELRIVEGVLEDYATDKERLEAIDRFRKQFDGVAFVVSWDDDNQKRQIYHYEARWYVDSEVAKEVREYKWCNELSTWALAAMALAVGFFWWRQWQDMPSWKAFGF